MQNLLHRFFEKLEKIFNDKFPLYIVKVSEMKVSFYVLIKKPGGKILNEALVDMFYSVKGLSEEIYPEFACYLWHFNIDIFCI